MAIYQLAANLTPQLASRTANIFRQKHHNGYLLKQACHSVQRTQTDSSCAIIRGEECVSALIKETWWPREFDALQLKTTQTKHKKKITSSIWQHMHCKSQKPINKQAANTQTHFKCFQTQPNPVIQVAQITTDVFPEPNVFSQWTVLFIRLFKLAY